MNDQDTKGWLKSLYYGVVQGENFIGSFLLLIIRLYWGSLLVVTGLGKLLNGPEVADFFASINIPTPLFMTYLVGLFEMLGGISLFVGLLSRIFTIPLVIIFIVAYITAHPEGMINFFIDPNVFIAQDPFLYLYASLVVLCFGPGFISLDYWWEKRKFDRAL